MPKGRPPTSAQLALGDAMRAIREEQGTSQERLALTAGIDRSYFSAIERGEFNVTLGVLLKVASGLGVPAWETAEAREAVAQTNSRSRSRWAHRSAGTHGKNATGPPWTLSRTRTAPTVSGRTLSTSRGREVLPMAVGCCG